MHYSGPTHKRTPMRPLWWLMPKFFDAVLASLYLGVLAHYLYRQICSCFPHRSFLSSIGLLPWPEIILTIGCILVLLSVDRIEYWRYRNDTPPVNAAILLLGTRVVLIEAVAQLEGFVFSPFLYLVPPLLACLYFGNITGYTVAATVWLVFMFKFYAIKVPLQALLTVDLHYIPIFTIGLIFVVSMGRVVRQEKASRERTEQLLDELAHSHQQLQQYSEQVAELATTRERNRLARDIHDSLGHYLTVINVQLEKALAFRQKKPVDADQAISDAKRLAREALQDVRRSVSSLRTTQDIQEFLPAMHELIERMRNEQYTVHFEVSGPTTGYSNQRLLTLYRAAQEGLTNIQKHAQAHSVTLTLHFADQAAQFMLQDDGRGFDLTHQTTRHLTDHDMGYGLRGIQERLEIIGGHMEIITAPGKGTQLTISMPRDGSLLDQPPSTPKEQNSYVS